MKRNTLTVIAALALCGCLNYKHARYSETGKKLESTSTTGFLVRGEAAKLHSATKDGDYSRTVNLGSLKGETETDKITALTEAIVAGAVKGAKP